MTGITIQNMLVRIIFHFNIWNDVTALSEEMASNDSFSCLCEKVHFTFPAPSYSKLWGSWMIPPVQLNKGSLLHFPAVARKVQSTLLDILTLQSRSDLSKLSMQWVGIFPMKTSISFRRLFPGQCFEWQMKADHIESIRFCLQEVKPPTHTALPALTQLIACDKSYQTSNSNQMTRFPDRSNQDDRTYWPEQHESIGLRGSLRWKQVAHDRAHCRA